MERLFEFLRAPGMAGWVFAASAAMFFGSIALAWYFIVRLPTDYLTGPESATARFRSRHPVVAVTLTVVKNLFGLLLLISGFIMLFIPGQGVLFMFLGVTLLDFPGKRTAVRRMLTWKNTLSVINRIRAKAGRPPIDAPQDFRPHDASPHERRSRRDTPDN